MGHDDAATLVRLIRDISGELLEPPPRACVAEE
jgi:hypothetical protein